MAKFNPVGYLQEVRQEINKVTWPTRRETMITTVMVLIMVFLAAVVFFIVDSILQWVVQQILFIGV